MILSTSNRLAPNLSEKIASMKMGKRLHSTPPDSPAGQILR